MFRLKPMAQDPTSLLPRSWTYSTWKEETVRYDLRGGTYPSQSNLNSCEIKKGSHTEDKWPDHSCVGQHIPLCSGKTSGIPLDSSGVCNVFVKLPACSLQLHLFCVYSCTITPVRWVRLIQCSIPHSPTCSCLLSWCHFCHIRLRMRRDRTALGADQS